MPPHPKFKKKNPTQTLKSKILNGRASGIQAMKYIRSSNFTKDLAFERACNQIEISLWGKDWMNFSGSYEAKKGMWLCLFMETYIKETGDDFTPALTFAEESFANSQLDNPGKISPVKAALIKVGEYKRTFKKVQECMYQGNQALASKHSQNFYKRQ